MDLAMLSFLLLAWALPNIVISGLPCPAPNVSYFQVQSLPDGPVLPRSWAGRIPVPGTDAGNSLFFWLFETEEPAYDDNLIIWLNGGPGCSSLIGLTTGNGPVSFIGNTTAMISNPYSWSKLGHVLYIDQPVGAGFSTASNPYPVVDVSRMTSDFYSWLGSFYDSFPGLLEKKTHIMGESYAGIFVPYFASMIMENHDNLPVNLRSISLGDGAFGNNAAMTSVAMGSYLRSQNSILGIPDDIISTFSKADSICGFDTALRQADSYPPQEQIRILGDPEDMNFKRNEQPQPRDSNPIINDSCNISPVTSEQLMTSILHSSCYGPCATFSTALDYIETASASGKGIPCFDVYNINHNCDTIDTNPLLSSYFSRADVQAALNILPTNSETNKSNSNPIPFTPCNPNIINTLLSTTQPSPPAYTLLPTLLASNISLHLYFGDSDLLVNHLGAELCLQNMTWNGAQGLSHRPNRTFFRDDAAPASPDPIQIPCTETTTTSSHGDEQGQQAGTWTTERGVTYHLFHGAGHSVVTDKPREMFAYVRDVVVGDLI